MRYVIASYFTGMILMIIGGNSPFFYGSGFFWLSGCCLIVFILLTTKSSANPHQAALLALAMPWALFFGCLTGEPIVETIYPNITYGPPDAYLIMTVLMTSVAAFALSEVFTIVSQFLRMKDHRRLPLTETAEPLQISRTHLPASLIALVVLALCLLTAGLCLHFVFMRPVGEGEYRDVKYTTSSLYMRAQQFSPEPAKPLSIMAYLACWYLDWICIFLGILLGLEFLLNVLKARVIASESQANENSLW